MTLPQASVRKKEAANRPGGAGTTLAAFLLGLPLGGGILALVYYGPLHDTIALRYLSHPVECVEVVMFCCAMAALATKLWCSRAQRRACRTAVLPEWDGEPVAAAEAPGLLAALNRLPARLRKTYLVHRVAAVLDFVTSRGSADDLDDQLRCLADNDALTQENSYSLIRFITWAIPILGFLGTVLGITEAISGVTPEVLEQSLSTVTDGLALAFDSTALALGLTMITMFCSFVTDRLEQGVLAAVDRYVERQLAHRFLRGGAEAGPLAAVERNSQALLDAMEQMVRRQATVWADTFAAEAERREEMERQQQERFRTALESVLEHTVLAHEQRLASLERQFVDQSAVFLQQLSAVAAAVREAGRAQQEGLACVAEAVTQQARELGRLYEGERQLVRLQESLEDNLDALAASGSFEQAVHSLTAAVHLLTSRAAALSSSGRQSTRPGAAA